MRQAIMTAPGEVKLGEADEPTAGPGQVRIRIQRIGVCGSDIHVYRGEHPYWGQFCGGTLVEPHVVSAIDPVKISDWISFFLILMVGPAYSSTVFCSDSR